MFRREYGRAVAVLARQFGDIALAEEAVQDAFTVALTHWAEQGIPPAPAGWIITTARRRAIDRLRREASRDSRQQAAMSLLEAVDEDHEVSDERLRLIFTCCHPALSTETQLALTLRLLGGLDTGAIASAFLVAEPTMAQRISRAKAKIRAAGIPYRVPEAAELPSRLRTVLAVVYLMFTEGHTAHAGETLQRPELIEESIRLGRLLHELLPDEPEVAGLLALMLLVDARRNARTDAAGDLVKLEDQDRARWDRGRIAEGQALLRGCLRRNAPGYYQLQAAINAVHSDANSPGDTDWRQILRIYDQLMAINPSAVVALNRAVAVAEVDGPALALEVVETLELPAYHLFHAVRAQLLRRLGREQEAVVAFQRALELSTNRREREFLERQRSSNRGQQ